MPTSSSVDEAASDDSLHASAAGSDDLSQPAEAPPLLTAEQIAETHRRNNPAHPADAAKVAGQKVCSISNEIDNCVQRVHFVPHSELSRPSLIRVLRAIGAISPHDDPLAKTGWKNVLVLGIRPRLWMSPATPDFLLSPTEEVVTQAIYTVEAHLSSLESSHPSSQLWTFTVEDVTDSRPFAESFRDYQPTYFRAGEFFAHFEYHGDDIRLWRSSRQNTLPSQFIEGALPLKTFPLALAPLACIFYMQVWRMMEQQPGVQVTAQLARLMKLIDYLFGLFETDSLCAWRNARMTELRASLNLAQQAVPPQLAVNTAPREFVAWALPVTPTWQSVSTGTRGAAAHSSVRSEGRDAGDGPDESSSSSSERLARSSTPKGSSPASCASDAGFDEDGASASQGIHPDADFSPHERVRLQQLNRAFAAECERERVTLRELRQGRQLRAHIDMAQLLADVEQRRSDEAEARYHDRLQQLERAFAAECEREHVTLRELRQGRQLRVYGDMAQLLADCRAAPQ